jgi:hypothetical protein
VHQPPRIDETGRLEAVEFATTPGWQYAGAGRSTSQQESSEW